MYKAQRILAIIPARGGSKRLKDKNIRMLCGKPLIAHSIEAAKNSKYVDTIVVSSDSERIGEVAEIRGAIFQQRPAELATDTTPTEPVLTHVLAQLENKGEQYGYVLLLQPTSPLRTSNDIDNAIEIMAKGDYDTVISVHNFHGYRYKCDIDRLIPQYIERGRSQDREVEYIENGAIYISRSELIRGGKIFGEKIGSYGMSALSSTDIDNEDDLFLAECIIKSQYIK